MGQLPYLNQLNEPTSDKQPDENARENCVATDMAAILEAETGGAYNGDEIKDAVYGQGYTGLTDPNKYAAYMSQHGVALMRHTGSQDALLQAVKQSVRAGGHGCFLIPSQWGTAPPDPVHPAGTTHCVAASYLDGNGNLHCMNPWGGFDHAGDDNYWRERICYGESWTTEKNGATTMSGVPSGWKDDGAILTAPNGKNVQHGFRSYLLGQDWDAANEPQSEEEAVSQVLLEDGRWGGGALQYFRDGALMYAPNPTGGVGSAGYVGPVPAGSELMTARHMLDASELAVTTLDGQLATAQKAAADAQSAEAAAQDAEQTAQQLATALQGKLSAAQQQISSLEAQLAALQNQPPAQQPPAQQPPAGPLSVAQAAAALVNACYDEALAAIQAGTPPKAS